MRLFVYGTLKTGFANNYLLLNNGAIFEDYGWIYGYEMWIHDYIPFVCESLDKENKVFGEIWDVPEYIVYNRIDRLEGHPEAYKRTYINQLNGVYVYIIERNIILKNLDKLYKSKNGIFNIKL